MNNDLPAGVKLTSEIVQKIPKEKLDNIDVVIAPPFIHLSEVSKILSDNDKISLGAQNCHWEDSGAFTGEVSVGMLKSMGTEYVIIGHSERRELFGESDDLVARKLRTCLGMQLTPIVCCGEGIEVRGNGEHFTFVGDQLTRSLLALRDQEIRKAVIAYEPIWAIGTGNTASPEQAQEMHAHIRSLIVDKFGSEVAADVSIIYGGSCNPSNARDIFSQIDVDGGLIGGASLVAEDFVQIIMSF